MVKSIIKHTLFLGILFAAGYYFWVTRPISHGPGEIAPNKPEQSTAFGIEKINYKNHSIIPMATFSIEARVLAKKRYYYDQASDIAPYDMVLGWGPMSDERNLDHILIKQSNRKFSWEMTTPPISTHEMHTHAANVHMIPSNPDLMDKLGDIRVGHVVNIKGYLVNVVSDEGWRKKTSLKRNDYGSGSTELLWIRELSYY